MYYLFGDCVLDLQRRELRRVDVTVSLEPKIYQVLVYLVQYRDRVVTREELLEQLWPGVYVDDSAVARCIRTIRRAVGDSPETQRVIQTRRGHGYRFVAAVTTPATRPGDTASPPGPAPTDMLQPAAVAPGRPCGTCHQPTPLAARFCPACGASLEVAQTPQGTAPADTPSPPEIPVPPLPTAGGEHKLVTVLCGLATLEPALAARLGLDGLHALFQDVERLVRRIVQPYGGTLQDLGHDRVLVVFGAPEAQEDHATCAVLAALALQAPWSQLLMHLAGAAGEAHITAVRCGLHTGLVVQERRPNLPHTVTVVGEIPALAVTLAQQAPPGTILVSAATAPLVRELVRLQALPQVDATDPAARLGVFRVQARQTRRSRGPREEHLWSHFVGREEELAMLQRRLEHMQAGHGQVVSLIGEPGLGKSRLLYEFWHSLRQQPLTYLAADCRSYSRATPYLPLLTLVRQLCGLSEQDPAATLITRVRARLLELGMAGDTWEPALLELLGLPQDIAYAPEGALQARQARTFAALHQLFSRCSQRQPLVLEVENLQWVDATSEAFLAELVERAIGARLLLLVTARPGYRPPWLAMSHVTQIALPALTPTASREVLQSRLSQIPLAAPAREQVVAKAQGNPFFLEELAQMVLEQGEQALHGVVPATVQAVLAARLDRLPSDTKALLHMASVIGREMPVAWLQALAGCPTEELQQHLQDLQRAEFLYETRLAPTPAITFKHALTQEVAYQSILSRDRQQLHARLAHVLVKQFPASADTDPALLAYHYTAANDNALASVYWQQAGQQALERSATAEAITHLTRSLALLKTLPSTPAVARQELMGQLALGAALTAAQGYTVVEAGQAYARAWVLSQQLGEATALTPALAGLWRYYAARGELQRAQALGEEGLALTQDTDDTVLRLFLHMSLGITLFYRGDIAPALGHFEQSLHLYAPEVLRPVAWLFPQDPAVASQAFAAQALWLLGYPAQALVRCQASLTLAQALASPFNLAYAGNLALVLHQLRREGSIAYDRAEEVMALCTAQGFTQLLAMATILRGWALAAQGQPAAGIAEMCRGLAANPAGSGLGRPPVLAQLAEAYWHAGQTEQGLQAVDESLAIMAQTQERWCEAEVYRLQGELILQAGQQSQHHDRPKQLQAAEACFQQALAIARRQQAQAWELRAATSLSRLWHQQGRSQAALHLLAESYAWFTEGFDTPDLQEARALLAVLKDASRPET